VALLSGEFSSWPGYWSVLTGGALATLMLVLSRPGLAPTAARVVPLIVSLAIFFLLPETFIGTWLVGMRMLVFVHIFATAAFYPNVRGRSLTTMRAVSAVVAIGCLLGHGGRMFVFDREMRGLAVITKAVPPYVDIHGLVRDTDQMSKVFGGMLPQTPAWVTAANGGFLENDYGHYFQLPIQRPVGRPWLGEYRWFVARGRGGTQGRVESMVGPVRVVAEADDWWLFESTRPPLSTGGLEVVRYAQENGRLAVAGAAPGVTLRVADRVFGAGLATSAFSRIQVRARAAGHNLKGLVGIDDTAPGPTEVVFEVMTTDRKVLFQSPPLTNHQPALPFVVPIGGRTDLLLSAETTPRTGGHNIRVDWLELRVGD
jgi:hypothetical protein